MKTLDALMEEAAARGLLLNNLFQFGPRNLWRANWRDDRGGHPFGEASSPAEAVRLALEAVPPRPATLHEDIFA